MTVKYKKSKSIDITNLIYDKEVKESKVDIQIEDNKDDVFDKIQIERKNNKLELDEVQETKEKVLDANSKRAIALVY